MMRSLLGVLSTAATLSGLLSRECHSVQCWFPALSRWFSDTERAGDVLVVCHGSKVCWFVALLTERFVELFTEWFVELSVELLAGCRKERALLSHGFAVEVICCFLEVLLNFY